MDSSHQRGILWGVALLLVLGIPFNFLMLAFDDRRGDSNEYPSDSDQAAIDFFHANRQDFEKIRSLVESHPFIFLAREKGGDESPPGAFRDAPEVRDELLRLMQALRLSWINGTESTWGIRLTFRSTGMAMAGTSKSFYHSGQAPPKNVVPSTESFISKTPGSSSAFRLVEPGWYLRLDWGG